MGRRIDNSDRAALFTVEAGRRIAAAVAKVEAGDRAIAAQRVRTAYGDDEDYLRLGRVSASWLKGDAATVTQLNADGSELSPSVTFQATNHFVDLSFDCGPKRVACANVGGAWILIAAEC